MVDWVLVVFKHGVTKDALFRALGREEIDQAGVDAPGGFELGKAYDGFLAKIGDRYGCGLCKEGRRTYWKHKKDAPRHLRKFHFGLADICTTWCVPLCLFYENYSITQYSRFPRVVTNVYTVTPK